MTRRQRIMRRASHAHLHEWYCRERIRRARAAWKAAHLAELSY